MMSVQDRTDLAVALYERVSGDALTAVARAVLAEHQPDLARGDDDERCLCCIDLVQDHLDIQHPWLQEQYLGMTRYVAELALRTVAPMTVAETIAAQFGNDGLRFENAAGNSLSVLAEARRVRRSYRDGAQVQGSPCRYIFADGSAITTYGTCWDLGYPECYCPAGIGHQDDCTARGTP